VPALPQCHLFLKPACNPFLDTLKQRLKMLKNSVEQCCLQALAKVHLICAPRVGSNVIPTNLDRSIQHQDPQSSS
jgi:hypothetical protein